MKSRKILVKTVALKSDKKGLNLAELIEVLILNTPPGGSTTDQIVKCGSLFAQFTTDRDKNEKAKKKEWVWWLAADHYATLLGQLDAMRWNAGSPDLMMAVVDFIKSIKEAKEEEVPGT